MISPFHVRHFTAPSQLRIGFFILFVLLISQASRFALFPLDNGLIPRTTHTETKSANMTQIFAQMPLYFIENQGQVDGRISYYLQGQDKIIYFIPTGLTIIFSGAIESTPYADAVGKQIVYRPDSLDQGYSRWVVKLNFVGANPNVQPIAQAPTQTTLSYFHGQPDQWKAGLRTYQRLIYPELWPGIDLVYYGTVQHMKYEFIVQPGADPTQIQLAYEGATQVQLTDSGQLEVRTPLGGFTDDAPVAYQDIEGQRLPVFIGYELAEPVQPNGASPDNQTYTYSFQVGDYDSAFPLVLDPAVLIYAGYLGGYNSDEAYDIALDNDGNVYVTGYTSSAATTFPVTVGPDLTQNGGYDAYVAKVNAAGTALIYAGYIGGSNHDSGISIAVDGAGNAYVTGSATSTETTFPVTVGPDLSHNGGITDAFVAKVNAAGTALLYAGYIGGSNSEASSGIAVDAAGHAYITGDTGSTEATFPVTVGPDLTYNGGYRDAFMAKVSLTGASLIYAGYIGGNGNDYGVDIAVDGTGNAYVTGETSSSQTAMFPVTVGPDLTFNGGSDLFVAKLNVAGTVLVYAGYIGGSNRDAGYGIVVDGVGNVYVTGLAFSNEATFPVTVGPDLTHNGGLTDAVVAKVNATGTALVYAGYIGGAGNDFGNSIDVDGTGNAYIVGYTSSNQTTFPVLAGPDLTYNGSNDAYVAKVNSTGTGLDYAGYIGGSGEDIGYGVVVDGTGSAFVTGKTNSGETTFPVIGGPDLTYNGGGLAGDGFVARVSELDTFIYLPFVVE